MLVVACTGDTPSAAITGTPSASQEATPEIVETAAPTATARAATPSPTPEATTTPTPTPDGQFALDGQFIPYPPSEMRWLDKDGFVTVPDWDDRNLTPEEKAADPVHDPRWAALVRCLDASGFDTLPPPDDFVQSDLDRLLEEINGDGPFLFRTDAGPEFRGTEAARAFTGCAEDILTVAPAN